MEGLMMHSVAWNEVNVAGVTTVAPDRSALLTSEVTLLSTCAVWRRIEKIFSWPFRQQYLEKRYQKYVSTSSDCLSEGSARMF